MVFNTTDFVNKVKAQALKGSNAIKDNIKEKKLAYDEKKKSIKELDYNQLKKVYESRTGKKAEVIQKDFNTGNIINKRAMTRGELELRVQFSKDIKNTNLEPTKKKSTRKSKPITINLKI